ncbi:MULTISPECIES: Hvo_1808 family surface protein [Halobacterium]|uniref:Hvo_1808 family surface protein n=1 Tax=Halobacterium TaxID=2239 RepID=UPI00073EC354|nr:MULTISPECIES: Hvo_1808 family surface protein [Halobacterium]MCG1001857.1 Hvo_1808 family surface protein [Halobacterium noricense]
MTRRTLAVAFVALVVLAGCQSPAVTGGGDSVETTTPAASDFDYADPAGDALGWEGGYWHNESLPVTVEDGLNETERQQVVNRSMARVEQLRGIEFDSPVPVDVISRSTYRGQYAGSGNASDAATTFDNVKFEALFLVGERDDSLDVQSENRGSNVLGFYTPRDDRIVVISESETPTIDENTLGHELMHALQFRNFDPNFSSPTRDKANAHKGLIEGEASFLDSQYSQRCGDEWECATPEAAGGGGGGGGSIHLGVYMMKYFPYSAGSAFVEHIYDDGGWSAVADVYDSPPASSEQVAQPEKYGSDQPSDVSLPDRSADSWERVTPGGRAPYGEVGVGGLTAMFGYPLFEQDRHPQNAILEPRNFDENGNIVRSSPFNYATTPVEGWDGEKLWVYENGNETAYTWRLAFDSNGDAREFARTYRQLLQYWGGEERSNGVWRIPEGESEFADAFRVTRSGSDVTIVNAPTPGDLGDVHSQ